MYLYFLSNWLLLGASLSFRSLNPSMLLLFPRSSRKPWLFSSEGRPPEFSALAETLEYFFICEWFIFHGNPFSPMTSSSGTIDAASVVQHGISHVKVRALGVLHKNLLPGAVCANKCSGPTPVLLLLNQHNNNKSKIKNSKINAQQQKQEQQQ